MGWTSLEVITVWANEAENSALRKHLRGHSRKARCRMMPGLHQTSLAVMGIEPIEHEYFLLAPGESCDS